MVRQPSTSELPHSELIRPEKIGIAVLLLCYSFMIYFYITYTHKSFKKYCSIFVNQALIFGLGVKGLEVGGGGMGKEDQIPIL